MKTVALEFNEWKSETPNDIIDFAIPILDRHSSIATLTRGMGESYGTTLQDVRDGPVYFESMLEDGHDGMQRIYIEETSQRATLQLNVWDADQKEEIQPLYDQLSKSFINRFSKYKTKIRSNEYRQSTDFYEGTKNIMSVIFRTHKNEYSLAVEFYDRSRK